MDVAKVFLCRDEERNAYFGEETLALKDGGVEIF